MGLLGYQKKKTQKNIQETTIKSGCLGQEDTEPVGPRSRETFYYRQFLY